MMKPSLPSDQQSRAERKNRVFLPSDFAEVIAHLPEDCSLIGGQAVAWWAEVYDLAPPGKPITSSDIDFWGYRDDLKRLATALGAKPIWPNQYEMTYAPEGPRLD